MKIPFLYKPNVFSESDISDDQFNMECLYIYAPLYDAMKTIALSFESFPHMEVE